jgi:acetylornithine deacetylase/succinyl-diaminopimelate desuccinylase-like protein
LWSEPGALYLTVEVTGRQGVVMAPGTAVPPDGLPARIGPVLVALSAWCRDYSAQPGVAQLGAAAGIGAISSGLMDKADLLPAVIRIALYAVTLPGADGDVLAGEVEGRVRGALADEAAACAVRVTAEPVHEARVTEPDASIVAAARQAWTDAFGAPPQELTGWTGSTDGVVLRGRGIDTVRLGPQPARAEDDLRRDVLQLDQLEGFVRIYRRLLDGPNGIDAVS